MIPSALAPALLAFPLAWRSRAYRGVAAGLVALAGLAVVREVLWALLGAPTPYSGALRWAWAVDGAGLLTGAAGRVVVAWAGLRWERAPSYRDRLVGWREAYRTKGTRSDDGSSCDYDRGGRSLGSSKAGYQRADSTGMSGPVRVREEIDRRRRGALLRARGKVGAYVGAWGSSLVVALWAAYPILRCAPWLTLSRVALVASAVLQFAAGAWWAASRALRPRAPITPREWTGLVFAAMAAWDPVAELAIAEQMRERWRLAVVGNWIGALMVCAAQAWGLWGTRRRRCATF